MVIEPFLTTTALDELIAEFPTFDSGQSANERGEAGRKAVRPDLPTIGPAYQRFDRPMRDREFLALMSSVTSIPELLYDPDYIGGGTHENLDGQELDTHVDFNFHPTRQLHRRLNLIVFLNREWDESWGGCLELLPDPWTAGTSVAPVANRCVIFETTESSWHGFRRIRLPERRDLSRRSIAVYFYTKNRPTPETAESHGTVYYQRPLPEHLRSGHTLTEGDAWELETLIARRDKQIQFLYHREQEFSEAIRAITSSPSFRIGRALTWPVRALRGLF
ncbi:MAG: 2OG-Fe(II) oxygenase [Acidobacteriia bacterium]|nr:2OG-Fe(II) oxygenase [Terriglobia bacterium]